MSRSTRFNLSYEPSDTAQPHHIFNELIDWLEENLMLDYYLELAAGRISGKGSVNKFGGGCLATADVPTTVWDDGAAQPSYPWPDTAVITSMSQDADQAAMRGESIEIQGLDANWALTVQTKALDATNTTTTVTLDTPLIRVFRVKVLADVVTDSNITIHNAGNTVDYAVVEAGNNQTLMALYTVPAGKTAYMTSYYSDVVNATGAQRTPVSTEVKLWAADRANGYEFQLKHATGIAADSPNEPYCFKPYYKFTEKTDIFLEMLCVTQPGVVYGGFDLILEDN